ncbi:MAG: site-specific integrase [Planctomycetota bacterium]
MTVKVYVIKREDRRNYVCQWEDPITGITKMKSAGTANRREADKFAGSLESAINEDRVVDPLTTPWSVLADRYENEVMKGRAVKTLAKFKAVRGWVERIINPKLARSVDDSEVSKLQGKMRDEGLAEATIKSNLTALQACLNWGKDIVKLITKVPAIMMPTRVGEMKGRALETTEFIGMLNAIPKVIGAQHVEGFHFLLVGLWLSGLRLDEALRLTWRPTADGISVEFDDGVPKIRIEANADKSTEQRLLPVAPDFRMFLCAVPEEQREGHVFNPRVDRMKTDRLRMDTCSKLISRLGEEAGIVVAEYPPLPGETEIRIKYASAHDLRRSFGTRWSDELTDEQLQIFMRHKDIETTRKYYAKKNLKKVEDSITEAMHKFSDTSSDILQLRRPA